MKRVDASLCIGKIILHAVNDPPGAIAGNYLDRGALLRSKKFTEFLKNSFSVVLCNPNNCVGFVIYNDCDVAVSFSVAGFINSNLLNSVKTNVYIRFKSFMDTCNIPADSTPVNPHIFEDGTAAKIFSHPGDGVIEVHGKVRVRECPGYVSSLDTMLFALNARNECLNVYQDSSKIQSSPALMFIRSIIDSCVTLSAYWAFPLKSFAQMNFD